MGRKLILSTVFVALIVGAASCIVSSSNSKPTPIEVSATLTPTSSPAFISSSTPKPVSEATPSPTWTFTAEPIWMPTIEPVLTPESQSIEAVLASKVIIREDSITIPTYQYQEALYFEGDFPYPRLDHRRVGPPLPMTYRLIVMENEYLEVSIIPELGGRIYQCIYKPTEQPLFYNNKVIKPTHWGPEEMGWWLAAGGMEWAFPVEEHGYLSAEPWNYTFWQRSDGGATVKVSTVEKTRGLGISVSISLSPKARYFEIAPRIENLRKEPQSCQFWLNAMLAPGGSVPPETHFVIPAQIAYVHSTGEDSLPGPGEMIPWQGSSLAYYANWPTSWLGLFFAYLTGNVAEAYNEAAEIRIRREFDPIATPGLKLFAFGREFDPAAYTDDNSRYIELWGGVTQDFWTYAELKPNQVMMWSERWHVITQDNR